MSFGHCKFEIILKVEKHMKHRYVVFRPINVFVSYLAAGNCYLYAYHLLLFIVLYSVAEVYISFESHYSN